MNRSARRYYQILCLVIAALTLSIIAVAQTKAPEKLTKKDLKVAILNAKTPEDHKRIAAYYKHDADRLDAEAKEHVALAEAYRKNPTLHEQKHPMSGETAGHCQWLADNYAAMAQKERELAQMHEDMAKQLSE